MNIFQQAIFAQGRRRAASGPPTSPLSPLNDISGAIAVYRSDYGVSQTTGSVWQWDDQTSFGNHLTQATAGRYPIYSGSNADFNNSASLYFDGANDALVRALLAGTASQTGWTMLTVMSTPSHQSNQYSFSVGSNASGAGFMQCGAGWSGRSEQDQLKVGVKNGAGSTGNKITATTNPYPTNEGFLSIFTYNSQSSGPITIYLNGNSANAQEGSSPQTVDNAFITGSIVVGDTLAGFSSANVPMEFYIAEIAIFNRQLSTSDINTIQQYVSAAYNISQSYV